MVLSRRRRVNPICMRERIKLRNAKVVNELYEYAPRLFDYYLSAIGDRPIDQHNPADTPKDKEMI